MATRGNRDVPTAFAPVAGEGAGGWGVGAEEVHSPDPNTRAVAFNMASHSCFHVFIACCQRAKVTLLRSRSPPTVMSRAVVAGDLQRSYLQVFGGALSA